MTAQPNTCIEDYALVGDCHGCALVSRNGAVDWLTLVRFDNSPDLWSILDREKGKGINCLLPDGFTWSRRYLQKTNILITEAQKESTLIRFTDFMPVGRAKGSATHDYTQLNPLHGFCRKVELFGEPVQISFERKGESWPLLEAGMNRTYLYAGTTKLRQTDDNTVSFSLQEDNPHYLLLTRHSSLQVNSKHIEEMLKTTICFWKEWIDYSQYKGDHAELIERSALTLKMLFHASTGAFIAAPTTSLPEAFGGERNWDYRYCWLRDSTFTLYTLSYLGFSGEADRFSGYLKNIKRKAGETLQVLYGLDGSAETKELVVPGVKGYRNSSPVRVGNDAYKQTQLDTHGEFIDWAYIHQATGGKISREMKKEIKETAEWVKSNWRRKDSGLWEIRGEGEDYTFSKVMCWVALDRAGALLGDHKLYADEKREIEEFVNTSCIENGQLKASAQNSQLDASLLLIKFLGFPVSDEVYEQTVNQILSELGEGMFIKRYNYQDGFHGKEGSFIICSFWAVNALLLLGRYEEAKHRFHELTKLFNDVGLISEECDPATGHFLGNYPQGFSHLALIESASYFELYHQGGKEALQGCHADRARRLHTTLHGPRAVWNFIWKTGKIGKIIPSQASVMRLA